MAGTPSQYVDRYRALGLMGGGMSEVEIERLEKHLGLPIPRTYHAYLAIAGLSPPPELIGSDCHGHYLYDLREWAIDLLKESGEPFSLPDNAIVFLMHQGYQFFFFHADGINDDPPVYYYFENRASVERPYERFSDWVAAIV